MIDKVMITLDVDSEGNEIRMTSEGFCVWYKDTQQSEYLSLKDCVSKMHALREHSTTHYLIWEDGTHDLYMCIDHGDKVWFRIVPQEGDAFKYETLKEALEAAGVLDTPQHRNIDWDALECQIEADIENAVTGRLDYANLNFCFKALNDKLDAIKRLSNEVKDMLPDDHIDIANDLDYEIEIQDIGCAAGDVLSSVREEVEGE